VSKPWLETWQLADDGDDAALVAVSGALACHAPDRDRLRLAAAAPALVRALLGVEWQHGDRLNCPACVGSGLAAIIGHSTYCLLDAALTAAGLDTQEKRDEARREMAERK
jgi:hypothetical protein